VEDERSPQRNLLAATDWTVSARYARQPAATVVGVVDETAQLELYSVTLSSE